MNLIKSIQNGDYDALFTRLYPPEELEEQRERWQHLIASHFRRTGRENIRLFSSPGRTELAGNHTDHNAGQVLAASVHLDTVAAVSEIEDFRVSLISEGYPPVSVDLRHLSPREAERGTTYALVRGIAACIRRNGGRLGGFEATTSSRVLKGSGLSSSAALEILVCSIFNGLFNGGQFSTMQMAQWSREAENRYFGKPCGLMDQLACATGGTLAIDFHVAGKPTVESVEWVFPGHTLVVTDCRTDHADLTDEYAAIPREMSQVARALGKNLLGELRPTEFTRNMNSLRRKTGDRAILRARHFFDENRRVEGMYQNLKEGRHRDFLKLMRESGDSSWRLLQNVVLPGSSERQEVAFGLALSADFLAGRGAAQEAGRKVARGACRVHGGGFGGTILTLLEDAALPPYRELMEEAFGSGCVTPLHIRNIPPGELEPTSSLKNPSNA